MEHTVLKKHELDIGYFKFYSNYVVSEIKKGQVLDIEKATKLFTLTKEYYGNTTPFVYISNRINSYSFEPTIHMKLKSTKTFPNIKGYAVVSYDSISNKIAQLEQTFINNIPCKIFNNIEEATQWANRIVFNNK